MWGLIFLNSQGNKHKNEQILIKFGFTSIFLLVSTIRKLFSIKKIHKLAVNGGAFESLCSFYGSQFGKKPLDSYLMKLDFSFISNRG